MLQDPNIERVIKNYTEPLQKQISMMQIELEALKQQCNIGAVSDLLRLELHDRINLAVHMEQWENRRGKIHSVNQLEAMLGDVNMVLAKSNNR